MDTEEAGYRSFLLRLWRVKKDSEYTWRASLENPRTAQKYNFASLEALCEYLLKFNSVAEDEVAILGP